MTTTDIICLEGNGARPSHFGNGWKIGGAMFTLNSTEVHAICYVICSFDSNSMKSPNPYSGIYEADTSRTLDLNGGNPACNQGGVAVVAFTQNQREEIRLLGNKSSSVNAENGTHQQTYVMEYDKNCD